MAVRPNPPLHKKMQCSLLNFFRYVGQQIDDDHRYSSRCTTVPWAVDLHTILNVYTDIGVFV